MDTHSQEDDLVYRNAQVVKCASFGMATLTVIALVLHRFLELPLDEFARVMILVSSILLFGISIVCDQWLTAKTSALILQVAILVIVSSFAWNTGGLNAPVMLLLISMPVTAALTLGSTYIIPSLFAVLAVVLFYTGLGIFDIVIPESFLPPEKTRLLHTNALLMVAAMMGIACHFYEVNRRRYQIIAETDGLTGIRNRRAFESYLSLEWRRQQRAGGAVSLIMFDIDDFKGYNDKHGHLAGDDCLKAVAAIVRNYTRRASEECFRYGGEEFCIILGNTPLDEAIKSAEKICRVVETISQNISRGFVQPVTLSAGVACLLPEQDDKPTMLVAEADEQLYRSKQTGRNRVCSSDLADLVPLAAARN